MDGHDASGAGHILRPFLRKSMNVEQPKAHMMEDPDKCSSCQRQAPTILEDRLFVLERFQKNVLDCFASITLQQGGKNHDELSSKVPQKPVGNEKNILHFNLSASTCDLSDDESSESSVMVEGRGWDISENQGLLPREDDSLWSSISHTKQRAQDQVCCASPKKMPKNETDVDVENGLLACTALSPAPRNPEGFAVPVFTIGWMAAFFHTTSFPIPEPIYVPMKVCLKDLYFVKILSGGVLQLFTSQKNSEGRAISVVPECEEVSSATDGKTMKLLSRRKRNCLVLDIAASSGLAKDQQVIYLLPVHLPPAYRNHTPSLTTRAEDNIQPENAENNVLFTPNDQHDAVLQLRSAIEATLTMSPAHLPHITHVTFLQD